MLTVTALSRDRGGYTLLAALLVIVAGLAVAAAVVGPSLVSAADSARLEQARSTLTDLTDSPDQLVQFEDDLNDFPATLSQLSTPITTSDTDLCGDSYSTGAVGRWAGPYVDRVMPETGTPIGIGIAGDSLDVIEISNRDAFLVVPVRGVRVEDAEALSRAVDGTVSQTDGQVRWTDADTEGLVLLQWMLEIRSC